MADASNPLDSLLSNPFSALGKTNGIKPAPYTPHDPITYKDGQWTQNGQPVVPGTGPASYAGGNSQPGAYTNAMAYLAKLNGPQGGGNGAPAAPGGPATAPGMNLTNPGANNSNMESLWMKALPQLMGQAGGQINAASKDPSSALAQALLGANTGPGGWATMTQ